MLNSFLNIGGKVKLVEKLKDQWICSCGSWVDQAFSWCPSCCEDQGENSEHMAEERKNPREFLAS